MGLHGRNKKHPLAPPYKLADGEGFEPPEPFGSLVLKTSAINQTLPTIQNLAEAERVERSTPEGVSRFERGGPAKCPTLPKLAEGTGLEPAHAFT